MSKWHRQTVQFINLLYGGIETGYVEIRMFNRLGKVRRIYRNLTDGPAQIERIGGLQQYNDDGYNIFLRIGISMDQRSRKEDIACLPALWVDIDTRDEAAYERLVDTAPTPNMVFATGGGWHAYWLLVEPVVIDNTNRTLVEQTLKGLAHYYSGDTQVAEVARIMRLPGFANCKYEHKPIAHNADGVWDGKSYRFELLANMFAPLGESPPIHPLREYKRDANYLHPFIERYLASPIGRGGRNKSLYVATCFYRDAGKSPHEAIALLSAKAESDGLKRFEIERTINSAYAKTGGHLMSSIDHLSMAINDKRMQIEGRKADNG